MQCHDLRDDEKMDLLYGEADPETTRRLSAHLEACAACREEMTALREVRGRLADWTQPVPSRPVARPRRDYLLPAAAAFLLALAGVVVLRGAEVRYDNGRMTVRLGHGDEDVRQLLAEQEARHSQEIAELRASLGSRAPQEGGSLRPASLGAAEVEQLIRDAENRLDQRAAQRLSELQERTDAHRRIDLARVSASLSYLEGRTGQHLARTNELMNEMLQSASYQR
jgi:hypothetical protein